MLEKSQARYRISVMVIENAQGVPEIFHIGAVRITTEGGTPGSEKVDPTPGGNKVDTWYSQMTFNNKYIRTNGAPDPNNPDPEKPNLDDPDPKNPKDSTLNITNDVTGNLGSSVLPFNYSLTLTVPTLIPDYLQPWYKAYLVDDTGVIDPTGTVNASLIGTDTSGNAYKYIRVTPGAAVNFQLKDGQSLVLINTPVGSSYNVTQTAEPGYTTSVTTYYNSIKNATIAALSATGYVGELFNAASYLNDFGDPTPGGLNISDMPFYGLILLAVGGLVLFVVVKARKRNRG